MSAGKRFITLSIVVAAVIAVSGCAGTRTAGLRTRFVEFDDQQRGEYEAAKPGEYRIQEGDKILTQMVMTMTALLVLNLFLLYVQ